MGGQVGTVNEGMFTSTTDDWPTPRDLFDALDAEFGFDLDPCASPENAKCARFYTMADDGLSRRWRGVVFMNPPYGRGIRDWIAKAWWESRQGATVVCLIPARCDTDYWHEYVMQAAEVRLVRGRIHFDSDRQREREASGESVAHNAPFPSAVVVFRPGESSPRFSAILRDGTPTGPTTNSHQETLDFGGAA